jgi:hypothetical protein
VLAGLLLAMDRAAVHVDVFGGPIEGHYTAGHARFLAGAQASRHANRFHWHTWLPHGELAAATAACHTTVCMDRAGPEAELGARTRVLYALHLGLRVLATPGSPIVHELVGMGLVEPLDPAHALPAGRAAAALAEALLHPAGAPTAADRHAWLSRHSATALCAPLREWARAPLVAPSIPATSVLGAALQERDRALAELDGLRGTPTYQVLAAMHRQLRKR